MNPCRLPQPSQADLPFFTDASGESALTPITGGGHRATDPHQGTLRHGPPDVHHLSIAGELSVYEVVCDGWQLKIINTNVPFGDATESFPQALAEAYRQMAIIAPAIIIGDMNAAPNPADPGGQATPQDHAVRDTIEMQGLVDLTVNLEGELSHFCHQMEAAPSRVDVCYGDPTTIIQAEARYGLLLLGPTGHRPLQTRLTIPNLPPSPPEDPDKGLPPRLKMPPLNDKQPWSHY